MSDLKTQKNNANVDAYLGAVDHETRRADSIVLRKMMEEVTGAPATMWGESIVGFGDYSYTYASGRSGKWFLTGFAPRKRSMTLYITSGFDAYDGLLAKLGKHKIGKACLYVNKLADIDMDVLRELIDQSVAYMKSTNS